MITESRLKIDRNLALSAAMGDILQINGCIVIEGRWNKESYEASVRFLKGIKGDVSKALDNKIEEMERIVERMV